MARVIIHIDLNAFFANAEIIRYPQYKNLPVVICKNTSNAIITTANYIARKYGIRSAMPLSIAKINCSNLIVIEPDFEYYKALSNKFIDLIKKYSQNVEKASIDECYIDVSDIITNYSKPLDLIYKIKNDILTTLELECSIGVAPNKFLAKMASDMLKPNGITILRKKEIKTKLWPLSIHEFYGIGKSSIAKCIENNLNTIGDIANAPLSLLSKIFGSNYALIIKEHANGNDDEVVAVNNTLKSISTSRNYFDGLFDNNEIEYIIEQQIIDVLDRLKYNNLCSDTVTLQIGYNHNKPKNLSKKCNNNIDNKEEFKNVILNMLENYELYNITFLGLGLNNCYNKDDFEINLFNFEKNPTTNDIINQINNIMNKKVLKRGNE